MRIILSTYVLVCFCSLIMQNFALAGENNNTFFLAQKNKEKGLLEKAIEKEIKKSGKVLIEKAIKSEIQKVGKRLIEKAIEKEINNHP